MATCLDDHVIKRCTRCILPDTVPNITFYSHGVCNCCLQFETTAKNNFDFEKKKDQFVALIKQAKEYAKKNDSKYDVLVALSGGRDSSYVAWKLATDFKMRVLCANYANPYTSSQAKKNIENLINVIGTKVVSFSYPNRLHERTFETNLKAWIKKPDFGTLCFVCLACKPIYYEIFQIAHQNKISLIVDGGNILEITTFKIEAMGVKEGGKLLTPKILSRFLLRIANNIMFIKWCNFIPTVKTLMSLHGFAPYLKFRYPNISKKDFFHIFPYNEPEINETLKKIGWKKADDNKSPWRMDCEIDMLKNYIYKQTINATQKDDLFSKNIRYGLMTREEAIRRLDEGEINLEIVVRILNSIGLNRGELDNACLVAKQQIHR